MADVTVSRSVSQQEHEIRETARMQDFEGKIAIVTGGARGLGLAYARRLAVRGAQVAVLDRDLNAAAAFGEEGLGDHDVGILSVQADLTVRAEIDAAIGRVIERFGKIDILVNNAGGAITSEEASRPSEINEADIKIILDLNLISTIGCCQAVLPIMKQHAHGVIVNTSSMAARFVTQNGMHTHYAFAKAAVTTFTRNLAAEVGPFGIRANCISPGIMMTGRMKAMAAKRGVGVAADVERIPLRRLGEPEDCAGVVEFLVSEQARYVTGQCISVCGGLALQPA